MTGRNLADEDVRGSLLLRGREILALFSIGVVMVLSLGTLMFLPSPALALHAQPQESPYTPPPPDGGGFFQPLEGLPVWAQAAMVSAAVSLTAIVLIEVARSVWRRWQGGHFDSSGRYKP